MAAGPSFLLHGHGEMEAEADLRAYDAIAKMARASDVVALGRTVLVELARTRRKGSPPEGRVSTAAADLKLTQEDAATSFGNVLDVLTRGPQYDDEGALARAITVHALLGGEDDAGDDRSAADVLWLASQTAFDATGLLDDALGDRAPAVWRAFADHVRRMDKGHHPDLGRGEVLVAATALVLSKRPEAREEARRLTDEIRDAKVHRILAAGNPEVRGASAESLRGEIIAAPRGTVATVALAATGILLVMHVARALGRLAFAYRKPAEVSVSEDGGVHVRWHTELLGRTLQGSEMVVPRVALARASREVRYPRLALYTGLVALSVGSYVGVATFVDGMRAASPSLLATGLAVLALGLALDFALWSMAPSVRGKCRLLFVSRDGRSLCVGDAETARADTLLARLARR